MLFMQQGSATYREITRNTGTKTHKAAIVSTWIHIRIMAVRICAVQLMEALYSPLQNVRHLVPIRGVNDSSKRANYRLDFAIHP